MNSTLLQLIDSGFPSGAFAHSAGLEALRQRGQLTGEQSLVTRLEELAWHTAWGALPFMNDAMVGEPAKVDAAAEVFLCNHVANRASRAMGRALLVACEALFERPRMVLPFGHVAVAFGASLADFPRGEVREAFLFSTVRGALSAAVRLNVVGPLRAQALLRRLQPVLAQALAETDSLHADDAMSVALSLDASQAAHDRLYSRLFQS